MEIKGIGGEARDSLLWQAAGHRGCEVFAIRPTGERIPSKAAMCSHVLVTDANHIRDELNM